MSKIMLKCKPLVQIIASLERRIILLRRNYSKDEKGKDESKLDIEEGYTARKGILHDKQQSLQEESYFHKEETEQLKELKKKIKRDKDADEKNKKD